MLQVHRAPRRFHSLRQGGTSSTPRAQISAHGGEFSRMRTGTRASHPAPFLRERGASERASEERERKGGGREEDDAVRTGNPNAN